MSSDSEWTKTDQIKYERMSKIGHMDGSPSKFLLKRRVGAANFRDIMSDNKMKKRRTLANEIVGNKKNMEKLTGLRDMQGRLKKKKRKHSKRKHSKRKHSKKRHTKRRTKRHTKKRHTKKRAGTGKGHGSYSRTMMSPPRRKKSSSRRSSSSLPSTSHLIYMEGDHKQDAKARGTRGNLQGLKPPPGFKVN